MKKIILLTLLGFIVFGCSSLQQTVTPVSQERALVDTPIVWKQSYFDNVKIGDSLFFYNQDSIMIEKTFLEETIFPKNGNVKAIHKIIPVLKSVPALTAGRWISGIVSSSGEIKQMTISFSKRKETTYNLVFTKQEDGSFLLEKNAYLVFKGYRYPVKINTYGDWKLRFYYSEDNITEIIKEQAEGWKTSKTETSTEDLINVGEQPTIER